MDKRPAGISILAFIYILVTTVGLLSYSSSISNDWFSYITFIILGVSAVALYMGKQWAWWVLGTMTTFSIMVNVSNLFFTLSNAELIPDSQKYYLKYGGKLVIQSLILAFLLSKPAFQFFAFKSQNSIQRLLILLGAAGMIFLGFQLSSFIQ